MKLELLDFADIKSEDIAYVMEQLKDGKAMALREYTCECSCNWPEQIRFESYAKGFTGEIMPDCPECGRKASFSTPWRIVRISR